MIAAVFQADDGKEQTQMITAIKILIVVLHVAVTVYELLN